MKETDSKRGPLHLGRKPAILLAAIALLAVAIPAGADAKKKGKQGGPKVTVMTRNVYLGADLTPAIDAAGVPAAIDAAGGIINELDSTKFADRAVPLAKEIKESKADLVGLQEVALWRDQTPSDYTVTPATNVRYDFLALLEQELANVGAKYEVINVQEEFDEELPADVDGSDATGGLFGADLDGRLTMRDVILARQGSTVKVGKTDGAQFVNQYEASVGGIPIPVERGWVSVEAKASDKKFRFVNTHLEAFGDPTIREAQARELFAKGGPLKTSKQVILVGDINSGVDKHNVSGADQLAFQALLDFGMKDSGKVHTCCYSDIFNESQVFDHTVDHVLTKPGLKTKNAFVTGNDVGERTASDLWPSDHGGLVTKLQLKK